MKGLYGGPELPIGMTAEEIAEASRMTIDEPETPRAKNQRRWRERKCVLRGGHWEDNQGFCHECGKILNRERAEQTGYR